jgi:hypothetical protein
MTTPRNHEEQKTLVASSDKNPYQTRFAWLPTKVATVTYASMGGGRKWIWLRPYNYYQGERLSADYVYWLSLPAGSWFPGVERHPFVRV